MDITPTKKHTIKSRKSNRKSNRKNTKKNICNGITGLIKCKKPYLCNLCYDMYKNTEMSKIEFIPYIYKGHKISCIKCNSTTFYQGFDKVEKILLKSLKKTQNNIYDKKKINDNKCALSTCGNKLGIDFNIKKIQICHKCLPDIKNLSINNVLLTGNKLSVFGECDTCHYSDSIYKFHKNCFTDFSRINNL